MSPTTLAATMLVVLMSLHTALGGNLPYDVSEAFDNNEKTNVVWIASKTRVAVDDYKQSILSNLDKIKDQIPFDKLFDEEHQEESDCDDGFVTATPTSHASDYSSSPEPRTALRKTDCDYSVITATSSSPKCKTTLLDLFRRDSLPPPCEAPSANSCNHPNSGFITSDEKISTGCSTFVSKKSGMLGRLRSALIWKKSKKGPVATSMQPNSSLPFKDDIISRLNEDTAKKLQEIAQNDVNHDQFERIFEHFGGSSLYINDALKTIECHLQKDSPQTTSPGEITPMELIKKVDYKDTQYEEDSFQQISPSVVTLMELMKKTDYKDTQYETQPSHLGPLILNQVQTLSHEDGVQPTLPGEIIQRAEQFQELESASPEAIMQMTGLVPKSHFNYIPYEGNPGCSKEPFSGSVQEKIRYFNSLSLSQASSGDSSDSSKADFSMKSQPRTKHGPSYLGQAGE